ncbi:hypothetical protein T4B_8455, partial [Trichinella pseudospiralis]
LGPLGNRIYRMSSSAVLLRVVLDLLHAVRDLLRVVRDNVDEMILSRNFYKSNTTRHNEKNGILSTIKSNLQWWLNVVNKLRERCTTLPLAM